MTDPFILSVGGAALTFMVVEGLRYRLHLRRLGKIPHRIHVNGSRGKSSVTRLIGAALRGDGRKVVVKTTGTTPRFIYPDGREVPIFRPGKPNIIEQLKVVKRAVEVGADTLVVECMAITPDYIRILEEKIVRSTVGVITNVREDHLDVMGPTLYDVAKNLALSLPKNGVAFTAEDRWFWVFEEEAKRRNTRIVKVSANDVSDDDMLGFPYIEHKENVAIALAVAKHFGVPREVALQRMYRVNPDPGVLTESVVERDGKRIYLFNAFAANDPDSTVIIWDMVNRRRKGKRLVVLTLRKDRPQRTESFARIVGTRIEADHYFIVGTFTSYIVRALKSAGVPEGKITTYEHTNPVPEPEAEEVAKRVVEEIWKVADRENVLVTMGNIVGIGGKIVEVLEKEAKT